MKEAEVRSRAYAMPLTSPPYPVGPYRFCNREFLIITYRTDPKKLRELVPEPLQIEEPVVKFEHRLEDIELKGAWTGPVELTLFSHALAPLAELPVLEVVSGIHIIADLTLGLGKVVHDYLASGPTVIERRFACV
jgi:acetoacetate decarboxylase